jgi:hypothetical protein
MNLNGVLNFMNVKVKEKEVKLTKKYFVVPRKTKSKK